MAGFPDEKALRGFRSKAQSRWAHATDQWWADEYEKNTDYAGIPDRVTEDEEQGIGEWGMPLTENHPFITLWDRAIEELKAAKTVNDFEKASVDIFNAAKVWNQDDNLKDRKIVKHFVGQYTTMVDVLKKWKEAAGEKIDPDIKELWDIFFEKHGNPKDDVWDPMSQGIEKAKKMRDDAAYEVGQKVAAQIDDDTADWISFELDDKEKKVAFIKGLIQGVNYNTSVDDTAAIAENALIRKASRQKGISRELAEDFWDSSVKEETVNNKNERKGKEFWSKVVERFKSKIRKLDVLEAKGVMDERQKLRQSIDNFINHLATREYDQAQGTVPEMIKNQLATMINRKKEAFLKDMGKQVKERAKEV